MYVDFVYHSNWYHAEKLSVAGNKELQKTKDLFADQCAGFNGGHCLLPYDLRIYHERV
jgi:hypothetical protein